MQISKEEIVHIAKLACLNLTEEEIEKYTGDMKEILEFANTINNVNTDGFNETIGTNERYNVSQYVLKAEEAIEEILSTGKIPIITLTR